MTVWVIGIGFLGWVLAGLVVCEACRIWRAWWINPLDPFAIALWPIILFFTIRNGPDQ